MAAALDADPGELLRAAGRSPDGQSFEETVLERLDKIGRDVRELKAAVIDRGTSEAGEPT